jgi:hypothetical protein
MNANQKKVMSYIKSNKIPLAEKNIIKVGIQESCEMAVVDLNESCLMMGNFWDFHPGCHGMKVPDFSSHDELAEMFRDALVASGNEVEIVIDEEWEYE